MQKFNILPLLVAVAIWVVACQPAHANTRDEHFSRCVYYFLDYSPKINLLFARGDLTLYDVKTICTWLLDGKPQIV